MSLNIQYILLTQWPPFCLGYTACDVSKQNGDSDENCAGIKVSNIQAKTYTDGAPNPHQTYNICVK